MEKISLLLSAKSACLSDKDSYLLPLHFHETLPQNPKDKGEKKIGKLSLIFSRIWQYTQKVEATWFCRLSCLVFGNSKEISEKRPSAPSSRLQNSRVFSRPAMFSSHAALEKIWITQGNWLIFPIWLKSQCCGVWNLGKLQSNCSNYQVTYCRVWRGEALLKMFPAPEMTGLLSFICYTLHKDLFCSSLKLYEGMITRTESG